MKSPNKPLRTAYFNKISSLTYNSSAVRVIGKATSDPKQSPYVQLSTQTDRQENGKSGFQHESTMLIEVIGYWDKNISEAEVDGLAEMVINAIVPDDHDYLSLAPDFKMITSKLVSDNDIDEGDDTRVYYRRLLRFEHKIQEL